MRTPGTVYAETANSNPDRAFDRMLAVYEAAAEAAVSGNERGAGYCLALLRSTLDYEAAPEIAVLLEGIYNTCDRYLENGDYASLANMLTGVRDRWLAWKNFSGNS